MRVKKAYTGVESRVEAVIADAIKAAGYDLWDISYYRQGAGNVLEITIDSPEGIGIDDCEKVSTLIDPLIDEADPIPVAYSLNVSSPGIERDLTLPRHFDFCAGSEARLKLFRPLPGTGTRTVTGILSGYDSEADAVDITADGTLLKIPYADIAGARLVYDFSAG